MMAQSSIELPTLASVVKGMVRNSRRWAVALIAGGTILSGAGALGVVGVLFGLALAENIDTAGWQTLRALSLALLVGGTIPMCAGKVIQAQRANADANSLEFGSVKSAVRQALDEGATAVGHSAAMTEALRAETADWHGKVMAVFRAAHRTSRREVRQVAQFIEDLEGRRAEEAKVLLAAVAEVSQRCQELDAIHQRLDKMADLFALSVSRVVVAQREDLVGHLAKTTAGIITQVDQKFAAERARTNAMQDAVARSVGEAMEGVRSEVELAITQARAEAYVDERSGLASVTRLQSARAVGEDDHS